MSEDAAVEPVEITDEQENDVTPPETNGWWQFQSKDDATNWVNEKIQKRLAREKSKIDPIISERDTLKAEIDRLKPFEQATKTDTQRWEEERNSLATELEDLRKFRAQQERSNLVREIAEDKGLPARFLNRVQGDDADSITADIEELVTVLNDGKPTKPASRKPVDPEEKPGSKGYGGGGSKTDNDDKAVVDNVLKKFREQRHKSFVR